MRLVEVKISNKNQEVLMYKRLILLFCVVANLGILFYFKYFNFAIGIISKLLGYVGISLKIPVFDIILPVGISFYTFQALGYSIDVYRGEINAEKNFLKYALFVSFFPQLVAGPIERPGNLLSQLSKTPKFNFDRMREGILIMLWGFFLKLVIADRIAIFVDTVYGNIDLYAGSYLIVASCLFAVQIYCDFAGYSIIAKGSAKILGIDLMENFEAPYLSTSIAEFWRKWHISLTTWFRDYLYIPLGGNKKGIIKRYRNILIVFFVSGLWHGASTSYIIWGLLNGLYQVVGDIFKPIRNKIVRFLNLNRDTLGHKIFQCILVFMMVDFSWIFFRAQKVSKAVSIIKSIISINNIWVLFDGAIYNCGLNEQNFKLMIWGIIILIIADICKRRGIIIREIIIQQDYWIRWLVFVISILMIITFGIWGPDYSATNFIYFQF